MMSEKQNPRVYGSYDNPEEIAKAIKELREQGYTRDEIKVYSTTGLPMHKEEVHIETNDEMPIEEQANTIIVSDTERKRDLGEDPTFWDQVKDFFTPDKYDYEIETKNVNYHKENDILYPHREELARGNRVIVLDKPNENQTRINI